MSDLDLQPLIDGQQASAERSRGMSSFWRDALITLGCTVMACYCSSVYGVAATISDALQESLQVSATNMRLLVGLSQLGLQFTLPAGLLLDRVGPVITSALGTLVTVASYVALSFVPARLWWLSIVLLVATSLGQGCSFLAAYKTGIEMSASGSGYSLGLISSGMSLSLFVSIQTTSLYESATGCALATDAECWRGVVRVWASGSAVAMTLGTLSLLLFRRANYAHLVEQDALPSSKPVGFFQGLVVWSHPYFLALFLAYFSSIGCAVFIISNGRAMWNSYAPTRDWSGTVLSVFSFGNAGSNFLTGILLDLWQRKGGFHSRRYWTLIAALVLVPYVAMAIIFQWANPPTLASSVVLAICFASCGLFFGGVLVVGGVVMGNVYGFTNLGVYYSYMQLGGSLAAVINPVITELVFATCGAYNGMFWGIVGFLLLSIVGLLFVPLTEYNIDSACSCRRRAKRSIN